MSDLTATLEVLKLGYVIDNHGIICNPGKFEGETLATLYYYDCFLNGDGVVMEVSEEERAAFDLAEDDKFVYLAESNDGFVSLEFYPTREQAEQRELDEIETDLMDDGDLYQDEV